MAYFSKDTGSTVKSVLHEFFFEVKVLLSHFLKNEFATTIHPLRTRVSLHLKLVGVFTVVLAVIQLNTCEIHK